MGRFEKIGLVLVVVACQHYGPLLPLPLSLDLQKMIEMAIFSKRPTGATYYGWTAHILLYQNQMRNLVQKKYYRGCTSTCTIRGGTLFPKRNADVICPFFLFPWLTESNPGSCWFCKVVLRPHSVYCLVDELRRGSFCPRRRKKNIHVFLARRRKNIKKTELPVFFSRRA